MRHQTYRKRQFISLVSKKEMIQKSMFRQHGINPFLKTRTHTMKKLNLQFFKILNRDEYNQIISCPILFQSFPSRMYTLMDSMQGCFCLLLFFCSSALANRFAQSWNRPQSMKIDTFCKLVVNNYLYEIFQS